MANVEKVDILGSEYTIQVKDYTEDEYFARNKSDGYCDGYQKAIVICNMKTHPNTRNEPRESLTRLTEEILRHEVVHAFLFESGLDCSSAQFDGAWATNEEMVDWIAMQFPKMMKVFSRLDIA